MLLLNNQPIKYFYFSGGEIQVKLPSIIKSERVILTWKPTKPDHIILLGLTVNALQEAGITDIDLDILYLPYARQDRVCSSGEAHSLKMIWEFLEGLKVSVIRIYDVHNEEACFQYLPNSYVMNFEAHDIFARHNILNGFDLHDLVICAPDHGARDRTDKLVKRLGLQKPVYLEKDRNPHDGRITNLYYKEHNRSVNGFDVMVVDDICDGGATFLKAAEVLKGYGAKNLYLYVTHGIFSKGLDELCKVYEHIYCHHVLDDKTYGKDIRLTVLRDFYDISKPAVCY